MSDPNDFELLLSAARTGDVSALQRLVEQYEPELRLVARLRLGAALRPHLDSIDLVQSVHRSLLIGIRENRFDISSPQKLIALALTIVRRKVARQWRHLKRQQRLSHHGESDEPQEQLFDTILALQTDAPDVADEVASRENLKRLLAELDPIENKLISMRIEGYSTVQVAQTLQLDPDVLRVKLSRLRKRLRDKGYENDLL
ncbi:MAG: sigma-70 family RNA polymerase sigma factor [Pirellula sp.]